jgi:hypothetical protein
MRSGPGNGAGGRQRVSVPVSLAERAAVWLPGEADTALTAAGV